MFEPFTGEARASIVNAQEEARNLGNNNIGTGHILLGLLREKGSAASNALEDLGADLREARQEVKKLAGKAEEETQSEMFFTPHSKKVIERAFEEARTLNHKHIGPEHLLLGITAENECSAFKVLSNMGIVPETLRKKIYEKMNVAPPEIVPLTVTGIRDMTNEERVEWFCKRYGKWPLAQALRMFPRSVECKDFFTFLLVICTTIDSLSQYWCGDWSEPGWSRFPGFLCSEYFDDLWRVEVINEEHESHSAHWYHKKPKVTYAERFYKNFHFTLLKSMFINNDSIAAVDQEEYFHFSSGRESHILGINPNKLLKDFETGVSMYLRKLEGSRENSAIRKRFHKVFDHHFVSLKGETIPEGEKSSRRGSKRK